MSTTEREMDMLVDFERQYASIRLEELADRRRISLEKMSTIYRALLENPTMREISSFRWASTFERFLEANRDRVQYYEEKAG